MPNAHRQIPTLNEAIQIHRCFLRIAFLLVVVVCQELTRYMNHCALLFRHY